MSLGLTFFLAIVLGAATGLLITFEKIFESVPDDQMFDDELFWHMAEDDSAGFHQHQETSKRGSVSRRRSRGRSSSKDLSNDSAIRSMAVSQESGVRSRNRSHAIFPGEAPRRGTLTPGPQGRTTLSALNSEFILVLRSCSKNPSIKL